MLLIKTSSYSHLEIVKISFKNKANMEVVDIDRKTLLYLTVSKS